MSLGDHLNELRLRIILCLIAVVVSTAVSFVYKEQLFKIFSYPHVDAMEMMAKNPALKFKGVTETFVGYFKLCLISGMLMASPVIVYQLWKFIAAGLHRHERRFIVVFGPFSFLLFLGGGLFAYFILIPYGLNFFYSFGSNSLLEPDITLQSYMDFFLPLSIAVGVVTQLPLLMIFFSMTGLIGAKEYARHRKGVILGAFIVGAMITPPDVVTQLFLAAPLVLLYEIGILGSRIVGWRKQK